jgi:deoxyribodipyrimidine photo-lyase
VFTTAASFRRHLQHELPPHLAISPRRRPVARLGPGTAQIPAAVRRRWPAADLDPAIDRLIAGLPIDHDVAPAPITGGALAAVRAWRRFRRDGLDRYAGERNQPDSGAQSQLSPYLHFGHLSVHQVFAELMEAEGWSPERLAPRPTGSRYSAAELEAAATGDPLWNASQTQLVRDGTIHNYLRMLWGKKILEWSPTPRAALDVMLELNNKYAVDGRDPNSYSGIFWVLGRYDRPWGPERPIFGKVRYMSSESAARKLRVEGYMARYRP